jgi:hypothetical protein
VHTPRSQDRGVGTPFLVLTQALKSFAGPSDKTSGDFELDICMIMSDDLIYVQHNALILNGKCCEDIKSFVSSIVHTYFQAEINFLAKNSSKTSTT